MALYPIDWLLFAILVAVIATWIVLDRLAASWQKQSERWLGEVDAHLQAVRAAIGKGEQGAQKYLPGDRRPYGAPAADLHRTLAKIRARQGSLAHQVDDLRGKCFNESGSTLLIFWHGFWARPHYHRSCSQDVKQLRLSAGELRELANDIDDLLNTLEGISLAAAQRCRDLLEVVQHCSASAQTLSAANAQDPLLRAARDDLNGLAARLKALPAYLLHGSEAVIRQQADKASVCDAWETLDQVEGAAQAYDETVKTWLALSHQIKQDLAITRQAVEAAAASLSQMPSTLDTGDLAEALTGIQSQVTRLAAWLECPDVENLRPEASGTSQLAGFAERLAEEAGALLATYRLFRDKLAEGAGTLSRVSDRMGGLAYPSQYSIEWQSGRIELDELRQMEGEIGKLGARRTPAKLRKDLERAQDLDERAMALESRVSAAQKSQAKLVPLLENPILPGQAWLDEAIRLGEAAKPYTWSEFYGYDREVRHIRDNAARLAERHTPVARYVKNSLPESILNQNFIDEVEYLIRDLKEFGGCLERVQGRLGEVTLKDKAARQALDSHLPRLEKFLKEWTLPEAGAQPGGQLADARDGLVELHEKGRRYDEQLKKRDPAQIPKIAKQVAAWTKSCNDAAQHLLKETRDQIDSQENLLEEDMRALQELAPFNKEPAMEDARDTIKLKRKSAKAWESGSQADLMGQLLPRANLLSTALVSFHQARQRIQEMAGDLSALYQEIETCRERAKSSLEQLRALGADQAPESQGDFREIQDLIKKGDGALKHQKDWGDKFDSVRFELETIAKTYYRPATDKAAVMRSRLDDQPGSQAGDRR